MERKGCQPPCAAGPTTKSCVRHWCRVWLRAVWHKISWDCALHPLGLEFNALAFHTLSWLKMSIRMESIPYPGRLLMHLHFIFKVFPSLHSIKTSGHDLGDVEYNRNSSKREAHDLFLRLMNVYYVALSTTRLTPWRVYIWTDEKKYDVKGSNYGTIGFKKRSLRFYNLKVRLVFNFYLIFYFMQICKVMSWNFFNDFKILVKSL